MADLVRTKTMHDGPRNAVMHFTNTSDGTGESAVTKVDVSTLSTLADGNTCNKVAIDKIHYAINTKSGYGGVQVLWDGDIDKDAVYLPQGSDTLDYERIGGLQNTATQGITGDIKFTTVGFTGTGGHDNYSITLEMKKKYTPTAT